MQQDSPVGSITKGGQPNWSFGMQGMSIMWINKAEALDRMAQLGFSAWMADCASLRAYVAADGHGPNPHKPDTCMASFFVAALAIENLLKGCLVIEHPEYIEGGRFHGRVFGSHDLRAIAADASVTLDLDEHDFCELGTESIRSFGRYHIGKNVTDSPSSLTVKDGAFPIYERLFNRLRERILAKPWKSAGPATTSVGAEPGPCSQDESSRR